MPGRSQRVTFPQHADPIEAIVIGGSAGSLAGVRRLASTLRCPTFPPALLVMHLREDRPSYLAPVLGRTTPLEVVEAEDKLPLCPGTMVICPPGYHMLVEADHRVSLSIDAPVHYSRPAIDPLFLSASEVYGPRLLAIVLSGASEDGARGLLQVKRRGGLTIVQDPRSAMHKAMPTAAIEIAAPALVLDLDTIAALLAALDSACHSAAEQASDD